MLTDNLVGRRVVCVISEGILGTGTIDCVVERELTPQHLRGLAYELKPIDEARKNIAVLMPYQLEFLRDPNNYLPVHIYASAESLIEDSDKAFDVVGTGYITVMPNT
ncbi:MAG TPA: hypothetical protein VFG73_05625 [Rhodanobacteraceae bacterium]|nr:hypothetical protein [Rhodanobacteraceae bacterium]